MCESSSQTDNTAHKRNTTITYFFLKKLCRCRPPHKEAKVRPLTKREQLQDLLSPKDQRNHYDLLTKLGSGGFGEVWEATAKNHLFPGFHDEKVAIKKTKIRENPTDIIAEISHLKQSNHSNIPKYIDSFKVEREIWIAMEYIDGMDIAKLLQNSPLAWREIAAVCHAVLSALTYLHDRKIIHRDVKGRNILVNQRGGVYLADLGLSVLEHPGLRKAGTTPFMAPEVINCTATGYKCNVDVWSLGMSIIEMVNQKVPHQGLEKEKIEDLILKDVRPNIEACTPSKMTNFLDMCLEWDPARRASPSMLIDHEYLKSRASEKRLASAVKAAHA